MNWRPAILVGTALALAAVTPAGAQDAPAGTDGFRLQPATPTAAPPVIAPPPPPIAPSATPTGAASPTPRVVPTPRATATPAPRTAASAPPRSAAASPTATPTPSATAAAPLTAPPPLASPLPEALPSLASEAPAPVAQPAERSPIWPWLAGAAGIMILGGAAFLLRRRKAQPEVEYFAEEAAPAPAPAPEVSPPAALPRATAAKPSAQPSAPEPMPLPEPALSLGDVPPPPPVRGKAGETLAVALIARRLSATLMNTALTYELTVTNTGSVPIGPIAVSGDMIGAHSSIPPKVLLETAADGEPQHRVPLLGPGESASMSGELRLPLAAITPIRHGAATLFVPLARFRLLMFRDGRPPVSANHAFVVGEEPATPGAALKPFRLDLGPRLYSGITQRELALPA